MALRPLLVPGTLMHDTPMAIPVYADDGGFNAELAGFRIESRDPEELGAMARPVLDALINLARLPTYVFVARRSRQLYPVYTAGDEVLATTPGGPVFRHAAAWTAALGVVIPFGGGLAAGLIWHYPLFECIFIGLLLTATSVSISAQTLVDLGKLRTRVGTTLLGAAVLDDVLGLLLLSVTLAVHSASGVGTVLWTLTRLLSFLGVAWFGGRRVIPWLAEKSRRWNISDPEVTLALLVLMALAFGAEAIGSLAAITGAFMAGVLFSHTDLRDHIDKAIAAMTYVLLVPLFLVSIGLNTDLKALSGPVLPLALVMCGVAIATKSSAAAWAPGSAAFPAARRFRLAQAWFHAARSA